MNAYDFVADMPEVAYGIGKGAVSGAKALAKPGSGLILDGGKIAADAIEGGLKGASESPSQTVVAGTGALVRSGNEIKPNSLIQATVTRTNRFAVKPGGTGATYDAANVQGVYVLKDSSGKIRYVGRGDALQRLLEHAKPGSGKEDLVGAILFDNNLSSAQARSLEDELMQMFRDLKI